MMRIVFAGTPDIAVPSLEAIADRSGWEIPLVLSQPDRRAGRGRKLRASPVKAAALARGLTVATPEKPKDVRARLEEIAPDAIAVVAYGHIFRRWLLELPRHGCVNVHFSLLPRHRGVAPVQWAVLEGDAETGVGIMRMDRGVDTGAVYTTEVTPIGPRETAGELLARLADIGAPALVRTLEELASGRARAIPQPEEGATYARRLVKEDGRIDWTGSAARIDRQVRGLAPWPGAYCVFRDVRLKIHEVHPAPAGPPTDAPPDAPGQLRLAQGRVFCGTGEGSLELIGVQPEGKPAMKGEEWARGARLQAGEALA